MSESSNNVGNIVNGFLGKDLDAAEFLDDFKTKYRLDTFICTCFKIEGKLDKNGRAIISIKFGNKYEKYVDYSQCALYNTKHGDHSDGHERIKEKVRLLQSSMATKLNGLIDGTNPGSPEASIDPEHDAGISTDNITNGREWIIE